MPPTYRFGPYVLDVHERRLTCGGAPCEVQGKVLDLLAALLERPGQLWAREALQARLWPGVFVSEDALFQVIRKADDGSHPIALRLRRQFTAGAA